MCPHCGEKLKTRQSAIGLLAAIVIGLLVGGVLYYIISGPSQQQLRGAQQALEMSDHLKAFVNRSETRPLYLNPTRSSEIEPDQSMKRGFKPTPTPRPIKVHVHYPDGTDRWEVINKWVDYYSGSRVQGVSAVHQRLALKRDGYAGLIICRNCRNLIRTLPAMTYDKTHPEDIDPTCEEHAVKALIYGLTRRKLWSGMVKVKGL